jgi:glucose-6-phosphate 1-dehydrogenase
LPPAISVVGFARRDKSDEIFRNELEEAARKFSRQAINDDLWKNFASNICYHRSEFDKLEGYETLARRLDEWMPRRAPEETASFTSQQVPISSK